MFRSYPDVVTLSQFRKMLGGMSDSSARMLMQKDLVHHYLIRGIYYIPKTWVIDYILSPHYQAYRKKLRAKIP